MAHTSVLLQETIDGLDIRSGDVFVDCTLGSGGHSAEVCRRFGSSVKLFGLDADSDAIARSHQTLEKLGCAIEASVSNFRDLSRALGDLGVRKADKILFDFGLSSDQFDDSGRGFSFQKDEPLLMTMKKPAGLGEAQDSGLTARDVVNFWEEGDIATILYAYGDERYSRRIARGIAEARAEKPIETTGELADIVIRSTPAAYGRGRIHPATRTFQAIRIAVNDELRSIQKGLNEAFEILNSGGRIAAISFHSGEDRIVKNIFRGWVKEGRASLVTKKPIVPSEAETRANPRSRSAKLRIISKK